jgi:ABC-2 type transport system permease protein
MKKMLLVMRYEIGASLHRKTFVIMAFGIPLVLGLVALVITLTSPAAGGAGVRPTQAGPRLSGSQVHEGYVDPGGLIRTLPADAPAGWLTAYRDESSALAAMQAGEISGYYVIPVDYARTGRLVYALPDYSPLKDEAPTEPMESVLLFNLLGGDAALAKLAREPVMLSMTSLEPAEAGPRGDDGFAGLVSTLMIFIIYLVVLLPASGLVAAITDEKKNRVMEVLTTSTSPQQLIAGKVLALGLLGLLQVAVWVGIVYAVVRFGRGSLAVPAGFALPSGLLVWAILYFLGGYAIYGTLMAGLGALAPDVKDTRGPIMLIMSPMVVAYLLNMIIIDEPNGSLALIASLFPLTSPVSMMARLTTTTVPFWQAAGAAALQLLAAVWIIRTVARLFRAQILLSGQPLQTGTFLRGLLAR